MGGTTAKACLIEHGTPQVSGEFEVDRMYRFKKGSGMPVTIPSIDMIEIGAGGGSIAWRSGIGLLKVGPQSAGSQPGPACYGRGGRDPCVTDADLALGLLDAGNFLGGDMPLDAAAAAAAIGRLAGSIGVTPGEAAAGIYRIVAESMAAAVRAHASDRGLDYRGLPLLAFGGAGPLHACQVAELLGATQVIFPPHASVLSAFGTLVTPVRIDLVRSALGGLAALDWAAAGGVLDDMATEGRAALAEAGCPPQAIRFEFAGDLRYAGQHNEVTVRLPDAVRRNADTAGLREVFERAYEALYGLRLADNEVELVHWRLTCRGPDPARGAQPGTGSAPAAARGRRRVDLGRPGEPPAEYAVHARTALAAGQRIEGPALIEERETTSVLLPGWTARLEAGGCLVAERR